MKDCTIPLDIIFINEDCEVISTITAKPNDPTIIEEDDVKYVLEVNANSLIRVGDEVDFEEEDLSDEEIDEESEEEPELLGGPEEHLLGDIIISAETASRQAEEFGHGLEREIVYLAVHGLLHLLGYDHMTDEDKAVMRAKEEEALREIRLSEEFLVH